MMSLPVWLTGPCSFQRGLCLWSHVPSRWVVVSVQGVSIQGGVSVRETPPDTHPTGKLSCYENGVKNVLLQVCIYIS